MQNTVIIHKTTSLTDRVDATTRPRHKNLSSGSGSIEGKYDTMSALPPTTRTHANTTIHAHAERAHDNKNVLLTLLPRDR